MNQNFNQSRHKVLVVVRSGHTYYLDIPYIRADPLAATIDWNQVCQTDCSDLMAFLRRKEITHIFVDRGVDKHVNRALDKLERMKLINEIRSDNARRLLNQRMTRKISTTAVHLYRINI